MKIISMTVLACKYCPFLKTDGVSKTVGLCRNTAEQRIIQIQNNDIPSWCPLPDDPKNRGK